MKILVLADCQSCFLSHTILTGLWEMDDVEVYEMPILQSVRGRSDCGYDLPGNPGGGMTGCTGYLQPAPLPEQTHTEEEILTLGERHFDLIVAVSQRDYVRRALNTLTTNRWKISSKLVVADGEDSEYIDREFLRKWEPKILFKREMTRNYSIPSYWSSYERPVMPLQFGAFLRSIPSINDEEKILDFFVSLGRTNPIRDKFLAACLDAVYGHKVCPPDMAWIATNDNSPLCTEHRYGKHLYNLTNWNDYMVLQGGAKIGASVIGFGRDCLHAWELFSQATLALYQDPGLHIPHPFKDGIHCYQIFPDGFSVLDKIIRPMIEHYDEYVHIARAGKAHCRKYHSTRARAEYLVDISMKVLGGEKIDLSKYGL